MKDLADSAATTQPRATGTLTVAAKNVHGQTKVSDIYQNGCLRALFPRYTRHLETVVINTSGGATGGDRLQVIAEARAGAHLTVTTQACERIYTAKPDATVRIKSCLSAAHGSVVHWLPQETIFYNKGQMDRSLLIDLASDARALIVEPVLFGRLAMGETQLCGEFRDSIELHINGRLVYFDVTRLNDNITAQLARPAVAAGNAAMATLLYRSPDALGYLSILRKGLNACSGCSLLAEDLCVVRLLAPNGLEMRDMMLPMLDMLTQNTLPKCWRL